MNRLLRPIPPPDMDPALTETDTLAHIRSRVAVRRDAKRHPHTREQLDAEALLAEVDRLNTALAAAHRYITGARCIRAALGDWLEDVDAAMRRPERPVGETYDLDKMRGQLVSMREKLLRRVPGYDRVAADAD